MRRQNLTMGQMSEFMAQEQGVANFARKKRRFGRRRKSSLTNNAVVGRGLGGKLTRLGAIGVAGGLGGTKKGRGLVKSGYGAANAQVGKAKKAGASLYGKGRNKFLNTRDSLGARLATDKNWRGKRVKAK